MLRHCYSVVSAPLPSAMQATALIAFLSTAYPLASFIFSKSIKKSKAPILAWMRNKNREDFAVNGALVEAAGVSYYEFIGLTYDRSGLDPQLVESRHATDDLIYKDKRPIIVQEQSRFGLIDTFNCPMIDSEGNVMATLHIAVPLNSPLCPQPHIDCRLETSQQAARIQTK